MPKAFRLVVINDGPCLTMEYSQTLAKGLNVIVGTLDEGLAGNIVNTRLLGRAVPRR